MRLLEQFIGQSILIVIGMGGPYGAFRAFELLYPRSKFDPVSQMSSLSFWPYYIAASSAVAICSGSVITHFAMHPLLTIDGQSIFRATHLGYFNYIFWPIVSIIVCDFFQYWMHRVQHRFFWRYHAIHHSIEELSAVNSYHHWTDPLFRMAMVEIPLMVLIGANLPAAAIVAFLTPIQGAFIHSNTRFNLGFFNRIIADNRLHRIHHSIESRHFDVNFGERTSIWDQLFGTAYFPAHDEWPKTGLTEEPEPKKTGDYLWRPFRWRPLPVSMKAA